MLPVLAINWTVTGLSVAFSFVCLFLMLVILIQKPKGGGLSGAFGGSGGSAQAAFGAKTGDVLTWFTVVCFALFLFLAMGLTWATRLPHRAMEQPVPGDAEALAESANRATDLPMTGDTPPSEEAAGAAATGVTSPDTTATPVTDQPAPATPAAPTQATPAPATEAPAPTAPAPAAPEAPAATPPAQP